MSDPKQVAHDKKVQQEKKHHHEEIVADAAVTPQPGKKPRLLHHASDKPDPTTEEGDPIDNTHAAIEDARSTSH